MSFPVVYIHPAAVATSVVVGRCNESYTHSYLHKTKYKYIQGLKLLSRGWKVGAELLESGRGKLRESALLKEDNYTGPSEVEPDCSSLVPHRCSLTSNVLAAARRQIQLSQ